MTSIKNFIWLKATTVALLCFASGAFAQDVTLTMKSPGSSTFAGVYTSPYTLDQDGVDISAFCITFSQDVEIGQQWEAEVKTLADPAYASNIGLYVQAYLAIQLTLEPDAFQRKLLSFAIWGAYDIKTGTTGDAALTHLASTGYGDYIDDVQALISFAAEKVAEGALNFDPGNIAIYTPTNAPGTCPGGPCPPNSPQTFMTVKTPEPPVLTQLGLNLFAFVAVAALVIRGRKTPISNPNRLS